MGRTSERIKVAKKAILAFEEVMQIDQPTTIERDAAIQRFEFTFEAVWKAAKTVLFENEGIDVASPKSVIRSSREVGIFTEEEAIIALEMVDDRNLTVHTYNERVAMEIYERLSTYLNILRSWLDQLDNLMNKP